MLLISIYELHAASHRIKTAVARRFSVEEQREQSKQAAQKQSFRELQVQK